MSKSTRVGLTVSSEVLTSLDAFCELTGYSRAAVIQSLFVNTVPRMTEHALRSGWYPLEPSVIGRYRGASGAVLDDLIISALNSVDYSEYQYDLLAGTSHE